MRNSTYLSQVEMEKCIALVWGFFKFSRPPVQNEVSVPVSDGQMAIQPDSTENINDRNRISKKYGLHDGGQQFN